MMIHTTPSAIISAGATTTISATALSHSMVDSALGMLRIASESETCLLQAGSNVIGWTMTAEARRRVSRLEGGFKPVLYAIAMNFDRSTISVEEDTETEAGVIAWVRSSLEPRAATDALCQFDSEFFIEFSEHASVAITVVPLPR